MHLQPSVDTIPRPCQRLCHVAPPLGALLASVTSCQCKEPFNLEGAEFLGDCVLDYLATVYLFKHLKIYHESVCHEARVRVTCNEVLMRKAVDPMHMGRRVSFSVCVP